MKKTIINMIVGKNGAKATIICFAISFVGAYILAPIVFDLWIGNPFGYRISLYSIADKFGRGDEYIISWLISFVIVRIVSGKYIKKFLDKNNTK